MLAVRVGAKKARVAATPKAAGHPPLVVDLDGTLINTDLLVETAFECVGREPSIAIDLVGWMVRGKSALKRRLAAETRTHVPSLPYNETVLTRIAEARAEGRKVYLASASDGELVGAIAEHLNCFDGWFASDGSINLARKAKAELLVREFGENGFDYIGNERSDLPVWKVARTAILVNAPASVVRRVKAGDTPSEILARPASNLKSWVKLLRPHQWAKNALVFAPVATAHLFNLQAFLAATLGFLAFSLCASSVYVVNDLVDIQSDRQHPTKKERPFARGAIPVLGGLVVAPALLLAAFAVAALVNPQFMLVLAGYLLTTTAYSFYLKRKLLIDAVTLAALYTLRVIGGAAAVGVEPSQWLLAFSMFLFLSLALIKRYTEMSQRLDAGLPDPENRNYRASDLSVISSLAASSGYSAVIVFSLYLSSDAVRPLYRYPNILWLACPVLLYWISRMLMMSHRRLMHEDPVVFALKDRVSQAAGVLIALLALAAI